MSAPDRLGKIYYSGSHPPGATVAGATHQSVGVVRGGTQLDWAIDEAALRGVAVQRGVDHHAEGLRAVVHTHVGDGVERHAQPEYISAIGQVLDDQPHPQPDGRQDHHRGAQRYRFKTVSCSGLCPVHSFFRSAEQQLQTGRPRQPDIHHIQGKPRCAQVR
eukprot:COSAG03_NODE_3979_length_1732_cov_13.375383_2_plen_161_part_00